MNFSLGQKKEAMNWHEPHALLLAFLYTGITPRAHCILNTFINPESSSIFSLLRKVGGTLPCLRAFKHCQASFPAGASNISLERAGVQLEENYEQSTEPRLCSTAACIGSSYRRLCLRRYSTMRHRLQAVPAFHKLDMRSW